MIRRTSAALAAVVLSLGAFATSCSTEPDDACEPLGEPVVAAIMQGMDHGHGIVGSVAGIRDGDWINVGANVLRDGASDPTTGAWRVHDTDGVSYGPISAIDPTAASLSGWPAELLGDEASAARSCVES